MVRGQDWTCSNRVRIQGLTGADFIPNMAVGVRVVRGQDWKWDNQVKIQGLRADFIPYMAVGVRVVRGQAGIGIIR